MFTCEGSRLELDEQFSNHVFLFIFLFCRGPGYDLCSAYDCSIPAHGKGIVKTDLSIAIPPNTYARIAPRSGLAVKNFIGRIDMPT